MIRNKKRLPRYTLDTSRPRKPAVFRVGDRVRTTADIQSYPAGPTLPTDPRYEVHLPAGSIGVIVGPKYFGRYEVLFEGRTWPHRMWPSTLEEAE